jgi:hypothetical protein
MAQWPISGDLVFFLRVNDAVEFVANHSHPPVWQKTHTLVKKDHYERTVHRDHSANGPTEFGFHSFTRITRHAPGMNI